MRNSIKSSLALVCILPVLGGCQSIFGTKSARVEPRPAASGTEFAAQQLDLGRELLKAGQYATAILAFRDARLSPEHAAAAYNGLAVAYSQLGRPDLTERFFRKAIALAPQDERYQRNLARFNGLHSFDLAVDNVKIAPVMDELELKMQLAAAELQQTTATPTHHSVEIEKPAAHLVRGSGNQVIVSTGQDAESDTRPALASMEPAARVVSRDPAAYPVRVSFSEVPSGNMNQRIRVSAVRHKGGIAPGYPVKVKLGSAQ